MTSDAIVLLKDDHKEIRRLFREFQRAGDKATKKKARLAGQIIEQLTVHTYIENEVMYPEVRALLPELEDDVLESYESITLPTSCAWNCRRWRRMRSTSTPRPRY